MADAYSIYSFQGGRNCELGIFFFVFCLLFGCEQRSNPVCDLIQSVITQNDRDLTQSVITQNALFI